MALGWKRLGLGGLLALGAFAFTWNRAKPGDYTFEVAPAMNALVHGDWSGIVAHQASIPPFSIVLRAPLVWVALHLGGDGLLLYRVGALVCVTVTVGFAVTLARTAHAPQVVQALIVLIAVATPTSADALEKGHPEEILGAALSVGAVVACLRGRNAWGALLLGLALATKQWALLAIGPVLLAAGRRYWWRVAAGAAVVAGAFFLPLVFADRARFESATRAAASAPVQPMIESWWYLLYRDLPGWLPQLTKPAIVLSAVPLTVAAVLLGRAADRALPLLALLFLLRCTLDPQTQPYYHLPLLVTALAWDIRVQRRMPYAALSVLGVLVVTNNYLMSYGQDHAAGVFYLLWTAGLTAYLLFATIGPRPSRATAPTAAG